MQVIEEEEVDQLEEDEKYVWEQEKMSMQHERDVAVNEKMKLERFIEQSKEREAELVKNINRLRRRLLNLEELQQKIVNENDQLWARLE